MMVVPAIKTINAKMKEMTPPIMARMRRPSLMPFLVGLARELSIIGSAI